MSSPLNLRLANATDELRHRPSRGLFGLLKIALWLWAVAAGSSAFARTPTTISLAVTSGGKAVSVVSASSLVTLTATVHAGSTLVKHGQVSFCIATAAHCTDIHLFGTAQLTSAGQAKLYLRPGAGNYSYKAEFLGTPKSAVPYAGSVSTVATLNVTGRFSTATTIAQSGSPGNYALTASVFGFTKSTSVASPTGTISFLDTTTGNSALKTATLTSVNPGPFWANVANPALGNLPGAVVAGDFKRDGKLDLAVAINSTTNPVGIFLGDGTGNFTPVTSNPITAIGSPVLVQDFNGDGIPDLLLSRQANITLIVLLGNGNGTFTEAKGSPISTNYGSFPVVTGDFNGDGVPDLAVAGGYYLVILLGNGDGTFTQMPINSSTITNADLFSSMVVGDFNGDGIPDLAALDQVSQTVSIFLGHGDGTFKQGSTITVSTVSADSPVTITVGDFNGDGKLDLAVPIATSSGGAIAILLGHGDGTFQSPVDIPVSVGYFPNRVAVGDFDGDGIPDLFAGAMTSGTDIFILLGNGDGTFVPASTGSISLPCCSSTVLGDFNGDGVTDLVSTDFYDGIAQVLLTALRQSAATATGVSVTGQSPQQVVASNPGDSSYASSESTPTSLLAQAGTSTAVVSSLNPSTYGQSVTFRATVTPARSGTPTGTVRFKDGMKTLGIGTLSGGVAIVSSSTLAIGSHSITGVYGGDANYTGSTSRILTQRVNRTLTTTSAITSSLNPSKYGQSVTLTVTVKSTTGTPTGNVTFKNGTATLGSKALVAGVAAFATTKISAGTRSITAIYGGSTTFAGSTSPILTQTVNKAGTTSAVISSLNPSTYGQSVTFTATVTSTGGTPTGTVTFKNGSATLGTGTLSGGKATFKTSTLSLGSHSITAVYAGSTDFTGSASTALTQTVK